MGDLEKIISPILVVNNNKLKPFIELFEVYPENINLQPLGTMIGFFKINDKSEDSSYIVNFLSSVIKKEYYINPKRPVSESLDGALHKVNLALSEIAKNGNIRWIGQLDSAVCVLEKNILHFTVSGTAQILLLRNQMLSNISQDLNPEELEPNPLKTFSNVSSGYLEKDDKIIITSGDLFNLFSLNEIKKGSLRFDQEKFVQFLKTAMVNELESAATLVVDINENAVKLERKKAKAKEVEQELNAFDGKTFEKPVISPEDLHPLEQTLNESEYTDEKTGHIYVQGESQEPLENGFWERLGMTLGEKMVDFSYWLKNVTRKLKLNLKRFFIWSKEQTATIRIALIKKIKATKKKRREAAALKIANTPVTPNKEVVAELETGIASGPIVQKEAVPKNEALPSFWKKIRTWFSQMDFSKLKMLLPATSKLKRSFTRLSYQQRLYAILILIAILVVPILILRKPAKEVAVVPEVIVQPSAKEILLRDQNIREISATPTSINSPQIKKVLFLNDQVFAVSTTEISLMDTSGAVTNFPLPSDFTGLALATSMDDLNLVFLLSDQGRLISFSPISKKFQENNLVLPSGSKIEGAGTYLTYLYLADSTANQIYRYPRAEGGFGSKSDWLKDSLDLKDLSDLAIEENLYLAQNNKIVKLFQGKVQPFNLTQTPTPFAVNKLFAGRKISNIYALDSQNGRVAKITKDGTILNQYYNDALKGALDFAVDEIDNKVFFTTSQGLFSFSTQ